MAPWPVLDGGLGGGNPTGPLGVARGVKLFEQDNGLVLVNTRGYRKRVSPANDFA